MIKNPNTELKRARKKGRAIVEEAKIRALSIVAQAYGEEIQKVASDIAIQFKNEALVELSRFKVELEQSVLKQEESVQKILNAEYEEVKKEIEHYKITKQAEIDRAARDTLVDLTKKVLGKSIDVRAHEDLVIQALEDAKRQNIF